MLWHFDELSEFARSGHGGFNATSDRGQTRTSSHATAVSAHLPTADLAWVDSVCPKSPSSSVVGCDSGWEPWAVSRLR